MFTKVKQVVSEKGVRTIGSHNPITVKAIERLKQGKPGDEITDEEFSEYLNIRTGVKEPGYAYVLSAIRYCERDGVVWQRAAKQKKLVCQRPAEIVVRSHTDINTIRKRARRSSQRISTVDVSDLPQVERTAAYAVTAQLGAIVLMSSPSSRRQLASSASPVPQIADVVKLFK